MQITSQVGPVVSLASAAAGTVIPVRAGNMGDTIVSELQGRYYENAYRRNTFAAYAGGVAASVAGTAMVGLILWNGSTTVNAVLKKTSGYIAVTSATTTGIVLGVQSGQPSAPTGTTAITAQKATYIGNGSNGLCTAYNAGTVVTAPTPILNLMHNTAAIGTTGEDAGWNMDLEGSIIVPPQTYAVIYAVGAATAAGALYASLMWDEIPV